MKKVNIVYFGTSEFAVPAMQQLSSHSNILSVVTQPPKKSGRGGELKESPVYNAAIELNLPILQPECCKDDDFYDKIKILNPQLLVVAAYGQFLSERLLQIPLYGAINIHGSLLPKLRGAAPIQRAIENGDNETGVTLIYMVKKMDAGDIICQAKTSINLLDTYGILHSRLSEIGSDLIVDSLPYIISGNICATKQEESDVTFAPPISKDERPVDWRMSAVCIHKKIMALNPNPVATTIFRGQPVKLYLSEPLDEHSAHDSLPGCIICCDRNNGLVVAAGGYGAVKITYLQSAGKKAMSGIDFCNGYQIKVGEVFS